MEEFSCFDVAIGLPGDVSNHSEDKRVAVAARTQNMAVVERGNNESEERDFEHLGRAEAAVRK